jgi:Tfp pilus assembly protein PilN
VSAPKAFLPTPLRSWLRVVWRCGGLTHHDSYQPPSSSRRGKKARREQFFVLAGLVSMGALIVFAGYTLIGNAISNQEGSNEFLKREIAVLDKQLDQIKRLKEQTQALLARKQVIENLQRDRVRRFICLGIGQTGS